ncbi:MAG TPA: hypothetical protein VLL52_20350 [Anaerolineae bacterium]|nr:hypothetical protein [Anaerolineae bacterium]
MNPQKITKLTIITLGLLLTTSLLLNLYLFNTTLQYYRQLNHARLDPLGLHPLLSPSPAPHASPT